MLEYRRNRVPGGTYFFTVNLANRRLDWFAKLKPFVPQSGKAWFCRASRRLAVFDVPKMRSAWIIRSSMGARQK
jgi:hypothetical protein